MNHYRRYSYRSPFRTFIIALVMFSAFGIGTVIGATVKGRLAAAEVERVASYAKDLEREIHFLTHQLKSGMEV